MELKKTQDIVLYLLMNDEKTRNSDDYLFYKVMELLNPLVTNMSVEQFLQIRSKYKLPSYESVSRTRRKIQHANPQLCGCEFVENGRILNEIKYKNYARRKAL